MNRDALFCDGTWDYVFPAEPDINEKVVLRFRTAHNYIQEIMFIVCGRRRQKENSIFMKLKYSLVQKRFDIILK